jgi:hypothetical protein
VGRQRTWTWLTWVRASRETQRPGEGKPGLARSRLFPHRVVSRMVHEAYARLPAELVVRHVHGTCIYAGLPTLLLERHMQHITVRVVYRLQRKKEPFLASFRENPHPQPPQPLTASGIQCVGAAPNWHMLILKPAPCSKNDAPALDSC